MNKTIAVTILAMAISLVACKSGEVTVTNNVNEVVTKMMCPRRVMEGQVKCGGEMEYWKDSGWSGTNYNPVLYAHRCSWCKAVEYYPICYPILRNEKVADMNWPSQNITNYSATNTYPPIWFTMATNPVPKEWLRIESSISTNWVSIGTYTPKTGASEDVQRGNIVTNTTAILEWKGKRHELLLESVNGPECGERRVPNPNQWPWRSLYSPGIVITNILLNDLIPHEQQGFTITNYYHMDTNDYWLSITNSVWIDHIEGTNIWPWIQVMTNSNHNYNLETKW